MNATQKKEENALVKISETEIQEIESNFTEARDFRSI
jgi:hypothetical protein